MAGRAGQPTGSGQPLADVPWENPPRIILVVVVGIFGLLFAEDRYRADKTLLLSRENIIQGGRGRGARAWGFAAVLPLFLSGIVFDEAGGWRIVLISLAVLVAAVASFQTIELRGWTAFTFIVLAIVYGAGYWSIQSGSVALQVGAAALASFALHLRHMLFSYIAQINISKDRRARACAIPP